MLKVYNFDFELIYAETKVKSTSWTLCYNKTGTFEAHLPLSSELISISAENKYLVICEGDKSAILTGREVSNELVLYGRTAEWILEKRIAPKTEAVTGQAGMICKDIVETAFSDVANVIVSPIEQTPEITVERTGYKTVSEAVSEALLPCGMGHKVEFNIPEKKWIFKAYTGREIPLLISEANKNAYDTTVNYDILDLADCGYYGENGYLQGENTGIYRWETVLQGESEEEAVLSLAERKENDEVSLKLRNLKLGTDYEIGDILRIQIIKGAWRTTAKKMISGVRISKKGGFSEEIPIFSDIGEE